MRRRSTAALSCALFISALLLSACSDEPAGAEPAKTGTVHAPLTSADCAPNTPNGKVTICHATSSPANPFQTLTISVNACLNAHVNHPGDEAPDCAGVCGGSAVVDCAGVCNGSAALDCAGVCNGSAVLDCAGACNGSAVLDCTGVCEGLAAFDCAGVCNGPALADCAGVCNGPALADCAGACNGSAVLDCAGVCEGLAVADCAGVCNGPAVADCAGVCNGSAVADCAGVCNGTALADCAGNCGGGAVPVDELYFTTNDGVFVWSSATQSVTQLSSYPSYAIALSPNKEIVVGTGGLEAQASGVPELLTAGVYTLDATGAATLLSPTAAEDLQFSPDGVLHASNSGGIVSIATDGTTTSRSTNPTSQFAFDSATTVVTTNGSVYGGTFGFRTDRLELDTTNETLLTTNGGEDVKVLSSGETLLCGQSGLFELLPSGALANVFSGMAVFNFGVTGAGNLYIGNTDSYGAASWTQGLFERPAGAAVATSLDSPDVNAMVVSEGCCLPSELDCAGVCNGSAVVDCDGVCNGGATQIDDVYFTTNDGVFLWSSDTASITQLSTYPSYAIAVSPAGGIVVGTGGVEAQATGVPELVTPGIYSIDGGGAASLISATAAEDLQFAPDGTLHAANNTGIYAIDTFGTATSRSSNPTSQFAFDSASTVITTNGSVYGGIFGYRTDRVTLDVGLTTLLSGDGGEDVKVLPSGQILLCGLSGIAEILPSGAFSSILSGLGVFNFGVSSAGTIYIGNTDLYGAGNWAQGLYERPAGGSTPTQLDTADINALVVVDSCR